MLANTSQINRIAFLGGHPPRMCGIATFTHDLSTAVAAALPTAACAVAAMNDHPNSYHYPSQVDIEIEQQDLHAYRRAADILNYNAVDVLSVQHEFGIFGGPSGSHVLALLKEIRMPIVTTLHTILAKPDIGQRAVMEELIRRSHRLVVMTRKGSDLLQTVYEAPANKIDLIPHGIPDVTLRDRAWCKTQLGMTGRTVLLTFGLLGPGKGIEYAIKSLPGIVQQHPDVMYIIMGATHPHLIASEGEKYRFGLEQLVQDLGLTQHVLFFNSFVSSTQLNDAIGAADIYVTPYLFEGQITSGTLVQVFGAGRVVVSTPYWHAHELLADDGGALVPFRDPLAITAAVNTLLDHPKELAVMQERNREIGSNWTWPVVAQRYLAAFHQACADKQATLPTWDPSCHPHVRPTAILDHCVRMSDTTGIFQHATLTVPNFHEGYSIDDNARAFILCVMLDENGSSEHDQTSDRSIDRLATSYLAYMAAAYNPATGRFRNFMTLDRHWSEASGSEDSHARTLWALGTGAARSVTPGHRELSRVLFERGLDIVESFTSPRAWAFTLLGIHEFLGRHPDHASSVMIRDALGQKLIDRWHEEASDAWPWFEHSVTYENARLCQALILSGHDMQEPAMVDIGLKSLGWLVSLQTTQDDSFRPIGSIGFYTKGGTRADFDQQPVEAQAMIGACLAAHRATADLLWSREATRIFEWFLGRNDLGQSLYDPLSGGCRDGLHHDRANENQGAESTLAFHIALADLTRAEQMAITATENI